VLGATRAEAAWIPYLEPFGVATATA
jgi:hypothetical protein